MTDSRDRDYHLRRAQAERLEAEQAERAEIGRIHLRLSALHMERAYPSGADEPWPEGGAGSS
jgi:hypothetical protein